MSREKYTVVRKRGPVPKKVREPYRHELVFDLKAQKEQLRRLLGLYDEAARRNPLLRALNDKANPR